MASIPTTGVSVLSGTGPCVPMAVISAYLPEPGEYALEIYAAPPGSEEPAAYHLVSPLFWLWDGFPCSHSVKSHFYRGTWTL